MVLSSRKYDWILKILNDLLNNQMDLGAHRIRWNDFQ